MNTERNVSFSAVLLLLVFTFLQRSPAQPVVIPLQLAGKLLIVDATVDNHQNGAFILDTGSSALILNRQYFRGSLLHDTRAIGISSHTGQVEEQTVSLKIGQLEWKQASAAIINLSHLEKKVGRPILGLIGAGLLEHLEVHIDFGKLQLAFYPLDQRGEHLQPPFAVPPPSNTFPLQFKGRVPYLVKSFGGRSLRLGLDSAAGVNILPPGLLPFVEECLAGQRLQSYRGVSGKIQQAVCAKVKNFVMGSASFWPMQTIFIDLKAFNRHLPGPSLDGLLGFEFFKQYKTAINFRKGELYLWNHRPQEKRESLLANSCE